MARKKQPNPLMDVALAHTRARRKLRTPVTPEEIAVALAWVRDEITLGAVSAAYQNAGGKSLYRVAVCLREAHRNGQLQVAA